MTTPQPQQTDGMRKKENKCPHCGNSGKVWSAWMGNYVPCETENHCLLEELAPADRTSKQSLQVPELTEELDRIAEDYDRYLQFIPEQFCSMCESHGDVIVPNSEESSKEQYPWFCTECEDASEVINLRQMLIAEIEEELALQRREYENVLNEAIELLEEQMDDEPCSYDHHGYCQTHWGGTDEDPTFCGMKKSKKVIQKCKALLQKQGI